MWFKHLQIYQIADDFNLIIEHLTNKLQSNLFKPCPSILPMSMGWFPPFDQHEDASLIYTANGNWLIHLKIEEKLLPATVVRDHTEERIVKLETEEQRQLSAKEKMAIRDTSYSSLLPKAFSKYSHIRALIMPNERLLIIDTSSRTKAEDFISFLRKTLGTLPVTSLNTIPAGAVMTNWLRLKKLPENLQLGENCILRDLKIDGATIRCSKQDLQSPNVQAFLKDGMEITQLQLQWKQHINFVLRDDFSITHLKFTDAVNQLIDDIHSEDATQQYNATFFIMTQLLKDFLQMLLPLFIHTKSH